MKVLVIGAGNMGLTYATGMSRSKLLKKRNIMVLDKSKEKMEEVGKIAHFDAMERLEDCVPKADIIFLAVKPYHAEELLGRMKELVNPEQLFISIMAGVTIKYIQDALGIKKVVRAMPNLPAQVGKGLTSYVSAEEVSRLELFMTEGLLDTTGKSLRVKSEKFIDASTGISGSGPAYVFYFMQSMMEAALQMGFSENVSKVLVSQTFTGAVELFNQSNLTPDSWMERVASKGGTTRAALDSMQDNNVSELIKEAAFAAFNRAVELGEEY
ncbi:pyrroline-5-carboxylate reductase [Flagellimonas taeanensis]|jgi:pyrroline-5-carboxylate reductase|uniref:Pyrroline-5-carboxylate reductase n=1 Tax=Flagellimonas taeanensis TaxID=1005926 RepID=A0A1M6T000_9FLAO|nr:MULTISPECIES: pyrroline-5-carboxylate reductase [Allomuricauda]MDC6383966.1 pyrroline-5-carboxylate reductase [Muricauda sp. SK9]MEE1961980.1 pyrroline-5-carboxylate reductase [Allomuricauda taeanensis]RIV48579.1 pyrroline-5-carboxylate reductase [Allomuricauda taeanensis]SFB84434.1 pyrroline-5-carboxylate reductase [Allomuricauda taeanensis]SHK50332.1 pyrroline-5-carboxylate reductase [Allomuricauda taeanensis]